MAARRSPRRRRSAGRGSRRVLRAVLLRGGLLALVAGIGWAAWLDIEVRARFEGQRWQVPAHIYARPLELYPGAAVSREAALRELRTAGYHASARLDRPASYRQRGDHLELRTRRFTFWDTQEPERTVRVRFTGGSVASMTEGGRPAALVRLEPVLIGRIHPGHQEDRVLVRLDEVPRTLVAALLAVEDRQFFEHHGVSPRGIARALLANLRAGATVQGGSTLTQQLAKSYFLSAERSLWRKLNDVAIALILEARYSKEAILEAYLNEVYLGQDGARAIHGFGLAARHYFARRLEELSLPEVALLAGLVKGPSLYNPRRHPERARERRDLVLSQMESLGMLDAALATEARSAPLGVSERPGAAGARYPGYLDLVRRQLARDYRDGDLASEGLLVFTTLDPTVQEAAQSALSGTLERIEAARSGLGGGLEGAVVVTNPQSGEVLAVVSGRDPEQSGFNRALDARRPVGSLIKPVVYLAALSDPARYTLATLIDDAPVEVPGPRGEPWRPDNYDGQAHGPVPLMEALARSYNLATVRLGLEVGVERVRDTLVRMGAGRTPDAYPSLLLGAVDLSPLEVAAVYQTIAAGGFRQPLRAIREVTDARGRPLKRYGLNVEAVSDPRATFVLTRALQEVMSTGTGQGVRGSLPPDLAVAGKTGTTDNLRDSWFAGFGGDRLAVVWVGRDDNRSARLTGASGALKAWTRLFLEIRPRPLALQPPQGIAWRATDLERGMVLDEGCAGAGLPRLPYIAEGGVRPGDCGGGTLRPASLPGIAATPAERRERRREEAR